MSFRLLVRDEAGLDIDEAVSWYEEERPGLGDRLSSELTALFERIERSPLQFPTVGNGVRRGLLHKFSYSVYFLQEEKTVTVLAVLHQRQDPDIWKRRL
jgi:plasmid stabilization system protein ParE